MVEQAPKDLSLPLRRELLFLISKFNFSFVDQSRLNNVRAMFCRLRNGGHDPHQMFFSRKLKKTQGIVDFDQKLRVPMHSMLNGRRVHVPRPRCVIMCDSHGTKS